MARCSPRDLMLESHQLHSTTELAICGLSKIEHPMNNVTTMLDWVGWGQLRLSDAVWMATRWPSWPWWPGR